MKKESSGLEYEWIWQTILIFIVGVLLLRITGRRSISQMSIPVTVMMIAIGTLLIQPVTGKGLWVTFGAAALLTLLLIVTEYMQIKFDAFETLVTGKAVAVIQDGQLILENMKKVKLSVDKLEQRLRQAGIANITDVEWATLEVSGQLGYQLNAEKQPATKADIQKLINLIETKWEHGDGVIEKGQKENTNNLFTEVIKGGHDSRPPEELQ